jgi:hypothetical protein
MYIRHYRIKVRCAHVLGTFLVLVIVMVITTVPRNEDKAGD